MDQWLAGLLNGWMEKQLKKIHHEKPKADSCLDRQAVMLERDRPVDRQSDRQVNRITPGKKDKIKMFVGWLVV